MFETLRKEYSKYLQQCFKTLDTATFQKKSTELCTSEKDRKPAVDQALKDTLLLLMSNSLTSNIRMFEAYIKFCIELCRRDIATANVPVMLLSDVFDAMTLDRCEELFSYVENNVNIWKEELFFTACKNNLLRMCNDLLRRLSRSQQTVFCGRILLFLAKLFPFSERSGLNIVSEFNLENQTEYGEEKKPEEDTIEPMETDAEKPETKISIDYNLYRKFWALQDYFRNPNQCYNKMQWKIFSTHASSVLAAFASFKLEDQKECDIDHSKPSNEDSKDTYYFAKYLTNEKLLELQLSDSNFRRYILLQYLILFQYLNSTVKFKSETHELKPDQIEWVNSTTEQVYSLITETPPDGPHFATAVKHILKREEYWNCWKNDGCPPFKRALAEQANEVEEKKPRRIKRRIGDIIRDAHAAGKFYLGNAELTKLWNLCPNNLEACKSKDRDFLPNLDDYFQEAITQLDPAAMVEDQYKKVNDGNFGWRALRLLAKRSPHFFVHGNNPINTLPEYLETMIKKIAKDRPPIQAEANQEKNEAEVKTEIKKEMVEATEKEQVEVKKETENSQIKSKPRISGDVVEKLAEVIKDDWKKLAVKLGFIADEIKFFGSKPTPLEQCKQMLQLWTEEDPEASSENLKSILEELSLNAAAEILKA